MNHTNATTPAISITAATAVLLQNCDIHQNPTSSHVVPEDVFIAFKNNAVIAIAAIIMNTTLVFPSTIFVAPPSSTNIPTRTMKNTISISTTTIWLDTAVIVSTSFDDAITMNAIANAAIAFRFFLGYSSLSIFSVPSTLVLSNIANTSVNTRRNGSTTSYIPIFCKNTITFPNGVGSAIYSLLFYSTLDWFIEN